MAVVSPLSTMRVWQYSNTKGGLEKNLKINPSAPLPKPKTDQHLVQIIAAALNPVDNKPAEIPGVTRFVITKPATLCIDFAGSVVKPAPGSSLQTSQLVLGVSDNSPLTDGALSEFSVLGIDTAVALLERVDLIDAATIGVVGSYGISVYRDASQKRR